MGEEYCIDRNTQCDGRHHQGLLQPLSRQREPAHTKSQPPLSPWMEKLRLRGHTELEQVRDKGYLRCVQGRGGLLMCLANSADGQCHIPARGLLRREGKANLQTGSRNMLSLCVAYRFLLRDCSPWLQTRLLW